MKKVIFILLYNKMKVTIAVSGVACFTYMGVFPACMYVCHMCSVLTEVRNGIRASVTGVIGGCEVQ